MVEALKKKRISLFLFFLSVGGIVFVCLTFFSLGIYFLYQNNQQKNEALEARVTQIQQTERGLSRQVEEALRTVQTLSQAQIKQQQHLQEEIEVVKGLIKQNTVSSTQNTLWQQIDNLNTYFVHLQFKSVEQVTAAAAPHFEPKSSWHAAWEELKSVIRITNEKENRIPLVLAYQEKAEVMRALQGWGEQAQWAILHKNHPIYLSSVQNLKRLVQDYFTKDATQIALLNILHQLETVRQII